MSPRTAALSRIALSLTVLGGCGGSGQMPYNGPKTPPDTRNQVTITQGVWGNVWFWQGNFMPGPGPPSGTITAVERDVLMYEPTKISSCERSPEDGSIIDIDSKLVATTRSNATGFYQLSLPPGSYSVFVKEGSAYMVLIGSSDDFLSQVTVTQGHVTKAQLDIKYEAYE